MDAIVTLETDSEEQHVLDATGFIYRHLGLDLAQGRELDSDEALSTCIAYNNDTNVRNQITHVKVTEPVPVKVTSMLVSVG